MMLTKAAAVMAAGSTASLNAGFSVTDKETFLNDVVHGLNRIPKQLPAKYFYDAEGDQLFQDIMNCADYYLTRCELEIFTTRLGEMIALVGKGNTSFDLIELGPGDCTKSIHLLRALLDAQVDFTYVPVDISANVITSLEKNLPKALPNLKLAGRRGDYFEMLGAGEADQQQRKVVLCLGANIGNMTVADSYEFSKKLRAYLSPGDIAIIGFDLQKDPRIIHAAYNDRDGITSRFNLNLLKRMNRELGANFDINAFEHYVSYDPQTGSSKSYLVSLKDAEVCFPDHAFVSFREGECIWMEISQKYTLDQIDQMAAASGFKTAAHLLDSKGWFADVAWIAA